MNHHISLNRGSLCLAIAIGLFLSLANVHAQQGWQTVSTPPSPAFLEGLKSLGAAQHVPPVNSEKAPNPNPLPPVQSAVARAPGAIISDPLVALADACQGDLTNIYIYCKNQIRYAPYHGLKKGSLHTYRERSGSPLDQACLFRDLLTAAGYTNVSLVRGGRIVEFNRLRGALGVPAAYTGFADTMPEEEVRSSLPTSFSVLPLDEARHILDTAFLLRSFKVPLDGLNHLEGIGTFFTLHSFWVKVDLPTGESFHLDVSLPTSFDPLITNSFHQVDLPAIAMASPQDILFTAGGTELAAQQEVQGLSIQNVNDYLDIRFQGLRNALLAEGELLDYAWELGGIQQHAPRVPALVLQPLIPDLDYWSEAVRSLEELAEPPDEVVHGKRIQISFPFAGSRLTFLDRTFSIASLAGRPIELTHDGAGKVLASLDGAVWQEIGIPPDTARGCRLQIDYLEPDLDVIYLGEEGETKFVNRAGGTMNLDLLPNRTHTYVYGFDSESGNQMLESQKQLQTFQRKNPDAIGSKDFNRLVYAHAGYSYLNQSSLLENLVQERRLIPTERYVVGGIVTAEGGLLLDFPVGLSYSSGFEGVRDAEYKRGFKTSSILLSMLEHSAVEQLLERPDAAVSTVSGFTKFASDGGRIVRYSATNLQNTFDRIAANPNVDGDFSDELFDYLVSDPEAEVLTVYAPSFTWGERETSVAAYFNSGNARMEINGGYNGGYALMQGPAGNVNVANLNAQLISRSGWAYQADGLLGAVGIGANAALRLFSDDPIDMGTGAFVLEATDLSFGSGYREGLTFTRQYNSDLRYNKSAGLGYGWTHNLDIRLRHSSNALPLLGRGAPRHCLPTLFAIDMMDEVLKTGATAKSLTITMAIANWLSQYFVKNTHSVSMGAQTMEFLRLPGGGFEAPPGVQATLSNTADGWALGTVDGHVLSFSGTEGRCEAITDPYNRATQFNYTDDKLFTVTDPDGRYFYFVWDDNKITLIREICGNQARNVTFDYLGEHLSSVTDPENAVSTYETSPEGLITRTIDANGKTVARNEYDANDRVRYQYNHGVAERKWTYFFNGFQNLEIDPLGGNKRYFYDHRGRSRAVIDQLGRPTVRHYDDEDRLVNTAGPKRVALGPEFGVRTTYDVRHNPVMIESIGEEFPVLIDRTINDFDDRNQLLKSTNPRSFFLRNEYDDKYNLVRSWDRKGKLIASFEYDANTGDLLKQAMGTVYEIVNSNFDSFGNPRTVTKREFATGKTWVTQQTFTPRGDQTHTLENKNATRYEYDIRGDRTVQRDPLGNTTLWQYDQAGSISSVTFPGNRRYNFTYDANDQLVETWTPLGFLHENEYDDLGRLVRTTEPSGDAIQYEVDANGDSRAKIIHPVNAPPQRIEIDRDLNGNRTLVHDVLRGQDIRRTYDAWNRVTSYTNERGERIGFEYDHNDNLTKLTYPNGDTVTYTYDAHDQMKTVTDWAGRKTEYVYDLNGRLVVTHLPNGTQRRNVFDAANRLVGRHELSASGETIFYSLFRFDPAGQIIEEVQFPPAQSVPQLGHFTATYDADNRMASCNGIAVSYDVDGNLLDSASSTYAYDSRNRLVRSDKVGTPTTYHYDAEDVLIAIHELQTGTETQFIVDPDHGLSKVLQRFKNGQTTRYVHGIGLIYETDGSDFTVYHYDYRGSTVALSDGNGVVTDRFTYTPYGVEEHLSGKTDTPFRFNGAFGVMTLSHELLYMRARFYHPGLKRFLNADPIQFGGGNNWYAFANGNPISVVDPFGLFGWRDALAFVPVLGSSLDAFDSFKKGNILMGVAHLGLAALDLTGGGLLVSTVAKGAAKTIGKKVIQKGGRGLVSLVKPSKKIDNSLKGAYEQIARSPEFARDLAKYNKNAARLGQKQAASVDEIVDAVKMDTTFAKTINLKAGVFVGKEHKAATRFFLQGNPASRYGPRVARHELTHLGAALRGQTDTFLHEVAVQAATTPEQLWLMGGMLGGGIGKGIHRALK